MLIEKKSGRSGKEDCLLAVVLAGSAGCLNVLALGTFGLFPSNMTGNATQLSTELLEWDRRDIQQLLLLLFTFLSGAFFSRLVVSVAKRINWRTVYAQLFLFEGVIIILAVMINSLFPKFVNVFYYIYGLCFLLGMHNSTSTQISQGKVRTTHITGTLTDMGIVLANFALQPIFKHSPEQLRQFRYSISIYLTALIAFILGGVIGIYFYQLLFIKSFILPGAVLIIVPIIILFRFKALKLN